MLVLLFELLDVGAFIRVFTQANFKFVLLSLSDIRFPHDLIVKENHAVKCYGIQGDRVMSVIVVFEHLNRPMQRRLSCLHDLVSDHTSWISPATLFEVIDGIASKDHCIGREEERPVVPDSTPSAEVVEKHIFDHVTVQVAADQAESDEEKKTQVTILS